MAEGAWTDTLIHDALQLIAESVSKMVGFEVAVLSVVRGEVLRSAAVAGSEDARDKLMGLETPMTLIEADVAIADDWGRFKFVPHERAPQALDEYGWVPDLEVTDDPDSWHPMDMLIAPLCSPEGRVVGLLSIDVPLDGRRPGATQRRLLERYAEQAERAVLVALEREQLAEQVRLAEAARVIVRQAASEPSVHRIVELCSKALLTGFGARGMYIQTFDADDGPARGAVYAVDGREVVLPPHVVELAERAARRAWERQWVPVVGRGGTHDGGMTDAEDAGVQALLAGIGIDTLLFVPLGAGLSCLGALALTRAPRDPAWTDTEREAALDIGHDLGAAILNARAFERERMLVTELQKLDAYKGQLIATVSHELKNPLTAIVGHLEMLEAAPELSEHSRSSVARMERGAQRLARVVDDLLMLAKVADPDTPVIHAPVDLRRVVQEAVELSDVAVRRRQLALTLSLPPGDLTVLGDAAELDRVLVNLVSNAVKYTPEHGSVEVAVTRRDDGVEILVGDTGIGISPEDQDNLFTEFFRSSNPDAVAQPGTGLGLAIVDRIVRRHGGRIDVESALGAGSTFRVWLPAVSPPAS